MNSYLANIDREAQEQFDTIIQQIAEAQGITEALKATYLIFLLLPAFFGKTVLTKE